MGVPISLGPRRELPLFWPSDETVVRLIPERSLVDLETNLDPGKLLDFHDVMLSSVQDDERVRQLWEASQAPSGRASAGVAQFPRAHARPARGPRR